MTAANESARGLVLWGVLILALAGVLLWALYLARHVLLLIYVSGLLAVGCAPLVGRLERTRLPASGRRSMPRWVAILIVYTTLLLALAAIGFMVVPPLVTQARDLSSSLPALLEQVQGALAARGITPTADGLSSQLPTGADVIGGVFATLWGVFGGLLGLMTILVLTFYLLLEGEDLVRGALRLWPVQRRERMREIAAKITTKVSAWLGAQLVLGAIIGTTTAVGLGLLGVPYFYVLAVIAAVGELIPYLGPVLAAIPAVALALTVSGKLAAGVLVFFLVQQQLENHILVPALMSREVGLSATGVVVAILIGGATLGVAGAILAVPTAAALQVIVREVADES